MFTGLIEQTGTLKQFAKQGNYHILTIAADFESEKLALGESIACDGACLTVKKFDKRSFTVEASQETAARTILEDYQVGSIINLERAMKLGDRLGGHLVSGHIDTVGKIDSISQVGESVVVRVTFDKKFDQLVIEKGSIAINGLSLTINNEGPGWLEVNLIPHTVAVTTAQSWKTGEKINLEFDMIGKYLNKMNQLQTGNVSIDLLKESGW